MELQEQQQLQLEQQETPQEQHLILEHQRLPIPSMMEMVKPPNVVLM